jgi:phosphate transport system substrate-binding protein
VEFLKKTLFVIALAAIAVFALAAAGCTKTVTKTVTKTDVSGTLHVGGSTTVLPLAQAAAEQFMAKYPNVKVDVQGTGSSQGITGATDGTLDIGTSSRELTAKETGLTDYKVCVDAVAIVVHPSNAVSNLTSQQVIDILSGKITNWKDVGGKDAKIQVIGRDEASGTRDYVQKSIIGAAAKFPADALAMPGTGQLKAAVAQTPDAIGYMSAAQVDTTVKAVKIDGVSPSQSTVDNQTYKYWRYCHMLTKGPAKGLAKMYIDFIMTSEFQTGTVAKEFYLIKK